MAMMAIYKKIDLLKAEIDKARPFKEELMATLKEKLRIEWTYNSNAMEGNTLTLGETAFFLREGLTSEGKPLKDYLEAKNHAEAIDGLDDIVQKRRPLTESVIKELHAVLLKDIEFTFARGDGGQIIKKPLNPGQYKTRPNHVLTLSGEIHHYSEPIHVKDEMEKLLDWYNASENLHPVEKAAIFHYRFAAIHPFDDGNGRMARLLMNLILIQSGYTVCIIKNAHRRKYLESLNMADEKKDYEPFILFVAEELLQTMQVIFDVIKGKQPAEIDQEEKPMHREERENLIIKALSGKTLSIQQIHDALPAIKRPTLKSDLNRLVASGQIEKKGIKKGTVYF